MRDRVRRRSVDPKIDNAHPAKRGVGIFNRKALVNLAGKG
jgi:hypothetical protein